MPRKNWNSQADWDASYQVRIRDPSHPQFHQKIGYGRLWAERSNDPYDTQTGVLNRFVKRKDKLIELFGMTSAERIIILGSAFGFLIETFKGAGFTNVWGIDDSGFIDTNKTKESSGTVDIIKDDFDASSAKGKMTSTTGTSLFDWVISESVFESYEDAEMPKLLTTAEGLLDPVKPLTNIIHIVRVVFDVSNPDKDIDPVYNQKTIAQWKAMRTTHSWVDDIRWTVG